MEPHAGSLLPYGWAPSGRLGIGRKRFLSGGRIIVSLGGLRCRRWRIWIWLRGNLRLRDRSRRERRVVSRLPALGRRLA